MIPRFVCLLRGRHDPARQAFGGFRCRSCGVTGRDLAQMGFPEEAYVSTNRRLYSRDRGGSEPARYGWGW
jgi:hypothetical protein